MMSRRVPFTIGILFALAPAIHAVMCPVAMVSGAGERDGISVTFRNQTKLPIRRLEFRCAVATGGRKAQTGSCQERNALFYPGGEYTVRYPYPGGVAKPVIVTVRSVMLMDGFVWKPTKHDVCRVLRIGSPKAPLQGTRRNTKE